MPETNLKNIAILCNPLAGVGRSVALSQKIKNELLQKGISSSLFLQEWPSDFTGYTDIFLVGGDGTMNFFINDYPGIPLPIVLFNGGTGNDFHWMLYGELSFEKQLEIALTVLPKPLDMGKCNGRFFMNGVGIGFEGEVAKALTGKNKKPGKQSFFLTVVKKIITYRSRRYVIKVNNKEIAGKQLLIDISNGKRAGGGFHIAPSARPDDGKLELVIAKAISPISRFRYLPLIEKGKHLTLSIITYIQCVKLLIESDTMIQYHMDGEYFESEQIEIEIVPASLLFRY